jgi:hypothetical protein
MKNSIVNRLLHFFGKWQIFCIYQPKITVNFLKLLHLTFYANLMDTIRIIFSQPILEFRVKRNILTNKIIFSKEIMIIKVRQELVYSHWE